MFVYETQKALTDVRVIVLTEWWIEPNYVPLTVSAFPAALVCLLILKILYFLTVRYLYVFIFSEISHVLVHLSFNV